MFREISGVINYNFSETYKIGLATVDNSLKRLERGGHKTQNKPKSRDKSTLDTFLGITLSTLLGAINQAKSNAYSQVLGITGTINPDNDIRQEIDRAQAPFLRQGIRIQSNGGAKDFAAYAEFTERNQSQRLLLAAEGERAADYGLHYALISGHPSSCPLCVPWQGEVVINDVFAAGVPDGKTPLMSSAIDAGLFHFNCRHNYVVFIPGHDKPDIFRRNIASPEETAKRYAIEQQQRYNERNIRDWKIREAAAMTDVEKATSALKVEEWQSQQRALRDLAAKEGVPFYRQYSREQIGGDTKPNIKTEVTEYLTKTDKSHNIKEELLPGGYEAYLRAKQSRTISADTDYNKWQSVAKELNERVEGVDTVLNVKAKITPHTVERIIGNTDLTDKGKVIRKPVSVDELLITIREPVIITDGTPDKDGIKRYELQGETTRVIINEEGKIISAIPRPIRRK